MSLSEKPRLIFMAGPDFGAPYPYAFAGPRRAIERMGLEVFYLNIVATTFELFRKEIKFLKPDLVFGFIQDRKYKEDVLGKS